MEGKLWCGKTTKTRHIVCQRTTEKPEKIQQAKNIMTAKDWKELQWEALCMFFTIIADILFGYCDVVY